MPIFKISHIKPQEQERVFEVRTASNDETACKLVCEKYGLEAKNLKVEYVFIMVGGLLLDPVMGSRSIEFTNVFVSKDEVDTGASYVKATKEFENDGFEVLGTFDENDVAMNHFLGLKSNSKCEIEEIRLVS